ncbi:phage tail tape measure protein [Ligilactobacillus salivarius]|uniref:phage tail tape measure protein n=3 Tax=Ligilactobacillus salivarius TaxID=1624 RepID=UPI000BB0C6E9|nr:phage tail tape measure protein [Ligilactobacillus salivarius]PAY51933.1 hypothetical protein A8C37_00940 [Ligilactobacillus salivarius]
MASQNLNIKVKLDFDETSLKNLNLGTVRVDPDVNHFKSKLRSALNGNFKITPKINTKGISNQLNNIKNDMREFRNAAKDPIKINFDVDKDVLSDLAVVSRQLEKMQKASASATKMKLSGMSGISKTGDDLSTLVTAARKANKEITALEAKKKALESTGRSLSDKDALKLGDFQKQAQEYSNAIEKIISEKQKLDEQALRSTFKNSEKPTEEEAKALAVLKEKYATMRAQTEEYSKIGAAQKLVTENNAIQKAQLEAQTQLLKEQSSAEKELVKSGERLVKLKQERVKLDQLEKEKQQTVREEDKKAALEREIRHKQDEFNELAKKVDKYNPDLVEQMKHRQNGNSSEIQSARADGTITAKIRAREAAYQSLEGSIKRQISLEKELARVTDTAAKRTTRRQLADEREKEALIRKQIRDNGLNSDAHDRRVNALSEELGTTRTQSRKQRKTRIGFNATMDVYNMAQQGAYAVASAVSALSEVDAAITRVTKVANAPQKDIDAFTKSIYKNASAVGKTAPEYANAVEQWITTGKSLKQSIGLAKDSVMGSFVGNVDVNDMVKYMAVPLNSFRKEGLKSKDIINSMNQVSNKNAIEMEDLGQAYSKASSVVASTGTTFSQLTGMITGAQEATRAGGDVIGRSIKAISLNFSKMSSGVTATDKKRSDFFHGLGVDLKTSSGKMKSTYQIMNDLSKVWGKLSKQQKSDAALYAAGKEHSNQFTGMLDNWKTVQKAMRESQGQVNLVDKDHGSAFQEFEKQQQSVQFHLATLKNSWTQMLNDIVGGRSGLNKIVDTGTSVVNVLDSLANNKIFRGAAMFTGAIAGISGLHKALSGLADAARDVTAAKWERLTNLLSGQAKNDWLDDWDDKVDELHGKSRPKADETPEDELAKAMRKFYEAKEAQENGGKEQKATKKQTESKKEAVKQEEKSAEAKNKTSKASKKAAEALENETQNVGKATDATKEMGKEVETTNRKARTLSKTGTKIASGMGKIATAASMAGDLLGIGGIILDVGALGVAIAQMMGLDPIGKFMRAVNPAKAASDDFNASLDKNVKTIDAMSKKLDKNSVYNGKAASAMKTVKDLNKALNDSATNAANAGLNNKLSDDDFASFKKDFNKKAKDLGLKVRVKVNNVEVMKDAQEQFQAQLKIKERHDAIEGASQYNTQVREAEKMTSRSKLNDLWAGQDRSSGWDRFWGKQDYYDYDSYIKKDRQDLKNAVGKNYARNKLNEDLEAQRLQDRAYKFGDNAEKVWNSSDGRKMIQSVDAANKATASRLSSLAKVINSGAFEKGDYKSLGVDFGQQATVAEGRNLRYWVQQKNTLDDINKRLNEGKDLTKQQQEYLVKQGGVLSNIKRQNGEITAEQREAINNLQKQSGKLVNDRKQKLRDILSGTGINGKEQDKIVKGFSGSNADYIREMSTFGNVGMNALGVGAKYRVQYGDRWAKAMIQQQKQIDKWAKKNPNNQILRGITTEDGMVDTKAIATINSELNKGYGKHNGVYGFKKGSAGDRLRDLGFKTNTDGSMNLKQMGQLENVFGSRDLPGLVTALGEGSASGQQQLQAMGALGNLRKHGGKNGKLSSKNNFNLNKNAISALGQMIATQTKSGAVDKIKNDQSLSQNQKDVLIAAAQDKDFFDDNGDTQQERGVARANDAMIKRGSNGKFKGKKDQQSVAKAIKANMKNGMTLKQAKKKVQEDIARSQAFGDDSGDAEDYVEKIKDNKQLEKILNSKNKPKPSSKGSKGNSWGNTLKKLAKAKLETTPMGAAAKLLDSLIPKASADTLPGAKVPKSSSSNSFDVKKLWSGIAGKFKGFDMGKMWKGITSKMPKMPNLSKMLKLPKLKLPKLDISKMFKGLNLNKAFKNFNPFKNIGKGLNVKNMLPKSLQNLLGGGKGGKGKEAKIQVKAEDKTKEGINKAKNNVKNAKAKMQIKGEDKTKSAINKAKNSVKNAKAKMQIKADDKTKPTISKIQNKAKSLKAKVPITAKDDTSGTISSIKGKVKGIKGKATITADDQATPTISTVTDNLKKVKNKHSTLSATDSASSVITPVTDNLKKVKNKNSNLTAKDDGATSTINNVIAALDKLPPSKTVTINVNKNETHTIIEKKKKAPSVAIGEMPVMGGVDASYAVNPNPFRSMSVATDNPDVVSAMNGTAANMGVRDYSEADDTKVDESYWRYMGKELYKGLPLDEQTSKLENAVTQADEDMNKLINIARQRIDVDRKQLAHQNEMRGAYQNQLNDVMGKLRGYGFRTNGNQITNLDIAKNFKGDKASKVNELLSTYQSVYQSLSDVTKKIDELNTDIWQQNKNIKDYQEEIESQAIEKAQRELEMVQRSVEYSKNLADRVIDSLSEKDYAMKLGFSAKEINEQSAGLEKLIGQFNKLSAMTFSKKEQAEKIEDSLNDLRQTILDTADSVLELQNNMKQAEIDQYTENLTSFTDTINNNIDRLKSNVQQLQDGLLSGTTFDDLLSSNLAVTDFEQQSALSRQMQQRIDLEKQLDSAMDAFAKKNVDRQNNVAAAQLRVEQNKYAQMLNLAKDYAKGYVGEINTKFATYATPTGQANLNDITIGGGQRSVEYTKAMVKYQDELVKLREEYNKQLKTAANDEQRSRINQKFAVQQMDMQRELYQQIINSNLQAIDDMQKKLKTEDLTTEQRKTLKESIAQYEKDNIDAQNNIKDIIKERFEYENTLIQDQLDKYQKVTDTVSNLVTLAKTLQMQPATQAKLLEQQYKSIEKQYNTYIALANKLREQQSGYGVNSFEWNILQKQIDEMDSRVNQSIADLLEASRSQFENTMEATSKEFEKSINGGRTADRTKFEDDIWIDGVSKQLKLEQLRQKSIELENEVVKKRIEALDAQSRMSKIQADYVDKQIDVLNAQQALDNTLGKRDTKVLTQGEDGKFNWTYMANQDDVDTARENLTQAKVDMEDYKKQMKSQFVDAVEKVIDGAKTGELNIDEVKTRLQQLQDAYGVGILDDIPEYNAGQLENIIQQYTDYVNRNKDILGKYGDSKAVGSLTGYQEILQGFTDQFKVVGKEISEMFGQQLRDALKLDPNLSPRIPNAPTQTLSMVIQHQTLEFPNVTDPTGFEEAIKNLPQIAKQQVQSKSL